MLSPDYGLSDDCRLNSVHWTSKKLIHGFAPNNAIEFILIIISSIWT